LICTLLAWIILRERPHGSHALSFVFAIIGFSLLSGITLEKIRNGLDAKSTGNLLILISLCGEAVFSVAGKKLVPKYRPGSIFGMALGLGVIFLTIYLIAQGELPNLGRLSKNEWGAILWLGPIATAAGYLYWMWALQFVSVATLAITLFIQPVAGAIFGSYLLGERFSTEQWMGGLLILVSVFAQDRIEKKFSKNA
jgi:drug/metabolite transporter (DMT)-like permease